MPITYDRLILKNGGRFDYWISNLEFVAQFIDKHKIQAIEREHFVMDDPIPISPIRMENVSVELKYLKPKPFPGGLKIPHLHFKNNTYLVTHKQWKDFSAMAVKNFQEKLAKAETVNFDQLMELSEAIDTLG